MNRDESFGRLTEQELRDPFAIVQNYCAKFQLLREQLFVMEVVNRASVDVVAVDPAEHFRLLARQEELLKLMEACYEINFMIREGLALVQLS